MPEQNKAKQQRKSDLILALFDGAIGVNFFIKPKISCLDDGTILITTTQSQMGQEYNDAFRGFARLYVTGPTVIEDNVTSQGWDNVQRGLGIALTGYFDQVIGPPGFAPFAAYAVKQEDGKSEAYIVVRDNIKNGDRAALKEHIDHALSEIDQLYQSGKVRLESSEF